MTALGVVVVSHNSEETIGACLDSLRGMAADVVVVDNASSDGTRQRVLERPAVRWISNSWNRGFAAAVNQGVQSLQTGCVLVLNPDTEVLGGLEHLAEACSDPAVAAAGGKLVDRADRPQTGFMVRRLPTPAALAFEALGLNRLFPWNPVNRRYRYSGLDPDVAADVEQPAGAFLAIRRDGWRRLGGFDERFQPLWFEDVDYCKRALEQGFRIRYVPQAAACHRGAHSARQLAWETRQWYWYGNLLAYAAKHFRPHQRWAVCLAVMVGSLFRAFWGIMCRGSLKPFLIYGRVIRLAGCRLLSGQGEGPGLSSAFARR